MGRILAIDYGRKRAGIAVTDPGQIIASPLTTVGAAEIISFLKNYFMQQEVDFIVVGLPRQMNNTPSESVQYIEPFIRQFKKTFPQMEIVRVDERFTSKMARQAILESGKKKSERQNKALVDAVSAAIILQSYLEMRDMGRFK